MSILFLMGACCDVAVNEHLSVRWGLLVPALIVFLVGLLDDLITLRPWHKIVVEIVAALLAYSWGIHIHGLLWYPVPHYVELPLTVAWLVGCTNAFNLIDGLDGLAAGVGLIATFATLFAGFLQGDAGLVTATAPLAGALVGFLIFNFNPASIFLGDGGSLWVGFMLACYGVIWSEKSVTAASITAPMMALSIPLIDTTLSIARRFLRRQPIFRADRGHIHHRLVDRGLSPRRAVLLLYCAGGIGATFSIVQGAAPASTHGLLTVLFCGLVWAGIRYLGYREFALAANLLRQNTLRSMLQSNYSLQAYGESLKAAQTIEECWRLVRAVAREFGFTYVGLRLAGHKYEEQLSSTANADWVLQIPVSDSDYVLFKHQFERSAVLAISPLADLLHRSLSLKTREFEAGVVLASGAIDEAPLNNAAPSVQESLSVTAS
ncbi:MAG: undecaprenyl/decaprenyl-phosphate alpha-N-acetylglucosaminyl 1-phosphate transferase [Acidobacteriaceae bacterium]|nr:undecaprenyl/decaprenyl-phosphate alpha-N-acetylglucosaminyl 1-phosphate transferase [Acidobacteriaceae bacterium]MBV9501252.1 undecaprenyl/decaprenyl-phosphate alpha-N-acetylglucosaminyl 1-phosphate transferase [Acidobacteriaceae bacterium]